MKSYLVMTKDKPERQKFIQARGPQEAAAKAEYLVPYGMFYAEVMVLRVLPGVGVKQPPRPEDCRVYKMHFTRQLQSVEFVSSR